MPKLHSSNILLIDDTPANISLLTTILEEKGYQISAASNGEQGIKIANYIKPDLILLDIMMSGLDGFETCKKLKSQPETESIPVIFISAKSEIEDILMGFSVGGVDYINKPFYKEEVCARISNQLKLQSLNRSLLNSELKMSQLLTEYQHQSERMQQIVDRVTNGIIEIDLSGNIFFANPAVEKLFAYSTEELGEVNFFDLLAEPYASDYQNKLEKNRGHDLDNDVVEILAKRKDNGEFPIEFSLIKISVGKETFMAVIHDITAYKKKEDKLRYLSNIDPLTKLVNRRYFDDQFEKEWQRNQRRQESENQLAFFMLDIDFFKQFNDTYGHKAGDDCLVEVAASIVKNTRRASDIVARLGGEEFGVIITETSKDGVLKIAEQIRSDIEALNIPHCGSIHGVVTISLGGIISVTDDDCESASDLYQKADALMYQAKKLGKNLCKVE